MPALPVAGAAGMFMPALPVAGAAGMFHNKSENRASSSVSAEPP
jgi:hypothetical protein